MGTDFQHGPLLTQVVRSCAYWLQVSSAVSPVAKPNPNQWTWTPPHFQNQVEVAFSTISTNGKVDIPAANLQKLQKK